MGASQSDLESFKDPGPAVTEERILRAIKSHEKAEDVTIVTMEDASGNVKGEGFMSSLVNLKVEAMVDGKKKSYAWVLKSIPREPNKAIMSMKVKADEREESFFRILLPKLRDFLTSKGVPELLPTFCPVPYSAWTEDDKVLIMQNLKEEGWRDAINKKAGLDIEHVRAAIKWMATFHAITFAFLDGYEGGLDQAEKDLQIFFWKFGDHLDWEKEIGPFRVHGNNNYREMFKGLEEKNPGKMYVKYLEDLIAKHLDFATAANKVRDDMKYKLKTICHGDPWFNNMMFKYKDDKQLDGVVFIDFQIAGYVSPALDLVYFMAASTTGELRRKYLPHILTMYHTIFINTVERFGVSVDFSYEELLEDFRKAKLHGLNFALQALPGILNENPDDIIDTEEWMKVMNEEDQEIKDKKMKEIMDQVKSTYKASDAMGERVQDLVDEWIEAGEFLEGLE
eukprot:GFUD01009139.1.p1 GENE.GFUD01009139.1~~GFUD01009139.1.p1  ORF type:complete len:452 (-),score=161.32 GFUD01009139.1:183-1538(-)